MHSGSSMCVGLGLTSCDELFGSGCRHRRKMDHFVLKLPWKGGGIPCSILTGHELSFFLPSLKHTELSKYFSARFVPWIAIPAEGREQG